MNIDESEVDTDISEFVVGYLFVLATSLLPASVHLTLVHIFR